MGRRSIRRPLPWLCLLGLMAAVAWAPPTVNQAQTAGPAAASERRVLVVSRGRVLEESRAARALAQAERELAERVQARIDARKQVLAAEEQELARLRSTMLRADFEERADAFRAKVQAERRLAQQRSAALQTMFRGARRQLVEALGPILTAQRAARGADVILNADAVLASDPAADITVDVLVAYDAAVPPPKLELPEILRVALEEALPDSVPTPPPGLETGQ